MATRSPSTLPAAASTAVERFAADRPGRSVALHHPGSHGCQGRRIDEPRPAASVVKLALAATALRRGTEGRLDLNESHRVGDLPRSQHRSLVDLLEPTTQLTIREICALSVATSDNPLAEHLRTLVTPDDLRAFLDAVGCRATRVTIGFADHELGPIGRGNVTTAADMVRLVDEILTAPDLRPLRTAMGRSVQGQRIPMRVRPHLETGHKTGTLDGVCNDVGFLTDGHTTLVLAFLCDGEDDVAHTSIEIADCARDLWLALGGPL